MGRGVPGRTRRASGGAAVETPRGQVLRDEDHLVDGVAELLHLGQHDVFGTRPLHAAERRNGTEAAAPVAPLGHLDIGPRRLRRGTWKVQEVEGGEGLACLTLVGEGAHGPPAQGHGHAEARHQVDLGQRRGELVAVAFGQTSRHHQARALVAGGSELENGVDRLLAGRLDEGAGVHHHELGVIRRRRGLVPVATQHPGQLVRVDLVLGTPQGFQPVSLGHQDNLPGRRRRVTTSGEGGI